MVSRPKIFRSSCLPPRDVAAQQSRKQYDARRGSASARGYNHRWARAADGFRKRNPLCIGCLALGRSVAAVLVDHVEPHQGDTKKFWDKSMWQPSCRWHHDVVKQRLEVLWKAGSIQDTDLWLNSDRAVSLARQLGG